MTLHIDEVMEEPEAPAPRKRWVTAVVALVVLALVGLSVLRLGGFDGNRYSTAALALTPYIAAAAGFVALVAIILRRRLLAFTALLAAVSLGVLLIPRYLADDEPLPPGERLQVLTANLLVGKADPATIVGLVRDNRVDVLVLQEVTPAAMAGLDAAGIADLLPHRVTDVAGGASGGAILATAPLRQVVLVQETTFRHPAAVVETESGVDVEIVSVHTNPPVADDEGRQRWQADLAALPSTDSQNRPRVLAGDFNATLDHRAFNAVVDRGYHDAAELTGDGLEPTWSQYPYGPPVTIDHVLVDRRLGVAAVKVFDLPGSDHNAVFAELALPR